jgi:hypothetical protein
MAVEPSKDVKSEADVDEVEKLAATDIWVIIDRDGPSECTWFSRAGEVGVEDGSEYASLEGKDREGIDYAQNSVPTCIPNL